MRCSKTLWFIFSSEYQISKDRLLTPRANREACHGYPVWQTPRSPITYRMFKNRSMFDTFGLKIVKSWLVFNNLNAISLPTSSTVIFGRPHQKNNPSDLKKIKSDSIILYSIENRSQKHPHRPVLPDLFSQPDINFKGQIHQTHQAKPAKYTRSTTPTTPRRPQNLPKHQAHQNSSTDEIDDFWDRWNLASSKTAVSGNSSNRWKRWNRWNLISP